MTTIALEQEDPKHLETPGLQQAVLLPPAGNAASPSEPGWPTCPSSAPTLEQFDSAFQASIRPVQGPFWADHAPPLAFSERLFPEGSIPGRRRR